MNEYKVFLNSSDCLQCEKFWIKANSEEEAREKAENIIDHSYWNIADIEEAK